MICKKLTVINPSGLHLRPAGLVAQTAMKFQSKSTIVWGEKEIAAKSVLNIMSAGIKQGTQVELICQGPDEEAAAEALTEVFENGFGEL